VAEEPQPVGKGLGEKVAEAREDGRQAGVRGLDLRYCPHDAHTVASLLRRIAWYQGHAAGERDATELDHQRRRVVGGTRS
jgi:hypothetical protein